MATKRRLDLPEDRPATFDEHGHHVALNPASVKGRFRTYRNWVYFVLIIIFLAIPWTKFQGHQTILLDIPNRRFAFFGLTFWAHDVPLMFFVLGILTVGLTFVTVIWGRLWCGWACPQTVFIDLVYRKIESWIEGNHVQRMHLAQAPMSWSKFRKKALKWFAFWFVSTNIAHSFTAYFVGSERLLNMSLTAPAENWTPFIFVTALTVILMFDFGWFREQFCMIMCPYGRFQSVLMDNQSLAVVYDENRGEPRKGSQEPGTEHADCINCYKCVAVCPTGIDIRRGVQMECVACTACIDACDAIMDNIGKPRGLIRYASEAEIAGEPVRRFRKRSIVYAVILVGMVAGLSVSVAKRTTLDAKFIRAIDTPYTEATLDDGSRQIINHYRIHVKNQSFDPRSVKLAISDPALAGKIELVAPTYPLELAGGESEMTHVFLKFPADLTKGTGSARVPVTLTASGDGAEDELTHEMLTLVGPI